MATNPSDKSFSVLTVSRRTGWEMGALESVRKQTVKPYSWVIITEPGVRTGGLTHDGFVIDSYPAPPKTKLSNLNASWNEGLRHIDTDYVIMYQDFIDLPEDCFEKLLALADERTWVSACPPLRDGNDDMRYTGVDCPRPAIPEEWEANIGIAPMKMIRELGGFDERQDAGWAYDNTLLARKAAMIGARFIVDESTRPIQLPHDTETHDTVPLNDTLCAQILTAIQDGKEDINCHCL